MFEWSTDSRGYDLSGDGQRVVRRGGQLKSYRPDDTGPVALHYLFGQLRNQVGEPAGSAPRLRRKEQSHPPFWARRFNSEPDALLGFVREFGFLGALDHRADAASEAVDYLSDQQRRLSTFYAFGMSPTEGSPVDLFNGFASFDMALRLERTSRGAVVVKPLPHTLLGWMYLQVAEEIAAGTTWTECRWCSKPFPRGGGRRHGAQRAGSHYCSRECRSRFNLDRLSATKGATR